MRTIYRFHTRGAADLICGHAQSMSKVRLYVENIPVTYAMDGRETPPGDWAICCDEDQQFVSTKELWRAIDTAIQFAFADELTKHKPTHPLLSIWHLKPENRKVAIHNSQVHLDWGN
jgi:hypothetical protein